MKSIFIGVTLVGYAHGSTRRSTSSVLDREFTPGRLFRANSSIYRQGTRRSVGAANSSTTSDYESTPELFRANSSIYRKPVDTPGSAKSSKGSYSGPGQAGASRSSQSGKRHKYVKSLSRDLGNLFMQRIETLQNIKVGTSDVTDFLNCNDSINEKMTELFEISHDSDKVNNAAMHLMNAAQNTLRKSTKSIGHSRACAPKFTPDLPEPTKRELKHYLTKEQMDEIAQLRKEIQRDENDIDEGRSALQQRELNLIQKHGGFYAQIENAVMKRLSDEQQKLWDEENAVRKDEANHQKKVKKLKAIKIRLAEIEIQYEEEKLKYEAERMQQRKDEFHRKCEEQGLKPQGL